MSSKVGPNRASRYTGTTADAEAPTPDPPSTSPPGPRPEPSSPPAGPQQIIKLVLLVASVLGAIVVLVQISWYAQAPDGGGRLPQPTQSHSLRTRRMIRSQALSTQARPEDRNLVAGLNAEGLPTSLVHALRGHMTEDSGRLSRYFDAVRKGEQRQLQTTGVGRGDVTHMMHDLTVQEKRRAAKLESEQRVLTQALRGHVRRLGKDAERLDEKAWSALISEHRQAERRARNVEALNGNQASGTLQPAGELPGAHDPAEAIRYAKQAAVQREHVDMSRARKRRPPVGQPVVGSANHHVAFRAFEARHTAELYEPLLQIDESGLGRKLSAETQDLPQDLVDEMEGATVAEHASLIHSLKAQRRGRLLFLFVRGLSEADILRDAEKLWKEEAEALAYFEATASKRWHGTVHELQHGVLKRDQLCDKPPVAQADGRGSTSPKQMRAVQRLLTVYDVEVNRRRQAISERQSLMREEHVRSLIDNGAGPEELSGYDEALQSGDEATLLQWEAGAAGGRSGVITRMNQHIQAMCSSSRNGEILGSV